MGWNSVAGGFSAPPRPRVSICPERFGKKRLHVTFNAPHLVLQLSATVSGGLGNTSGSLRLTRETLSDIRLEDLSSMKVTLTEQGRNFGSLLDAVQLHAGDLGQANG